MLGQEELKEKLFSYSLDTLPKTILLLGEGGCGKHTLVKEMSVYYNLDFYDISELLTQEYLSEIRLKSSPSLYLINLESITEKSQNTILKFLEEPSDSAYIVLIGSTKTGVLPTILNRCMEFNFKPYTKSELKQFLLSEDESILEMCTTPGQVKSANGNFESMLDTCLKIATKLNVASLGNSLSIVDKINYKDDFDKYDLQLFLKVLTTTLLDSYKAGNSVAYILYATLLDEKKKLVDSRLNKEIFMEHLITVLWMRSREQ